MFRLSGVFLLSLFVAIMTVTFSPAKAATIDAWYVGCNFAIIQGDVEVDAPYVRVQVATASNLNNVLATRVVSTNGSHYWAFAFYERQPEGTLLIISIGEWDGEAYLRPATMTSAECGRRVARTPTPPPTSTPFLPPVTPTYPPTLVPTLPPDPTYTPVAPTSGIASGRWTHVSTLIEHGCTVPGAPQPGSSSTISLTLTPSPDSTWITLQYNAGTSFTLSQVTPMVYTATYGQAATVEVKLTFTSPTSYTAEETVIHESGCVVRSTWEGWYVGT